MESLTVDPPAKGRVHKPAPCQHGQHLHGSEPRRMLSTLYLPRWAFLRAAMSNFFMRRNASWTRLAAARSLSARSWLSTLGTICQVTPYLSVSQPQASLSGWAESFFQ